MLTQGEIDGQCSLRAASARPMAHPGAGPRAPGQEPAQKDGWSLVSPALSKRSLWWGSLLKRKPKAALGPLTGSSLHPWTCSPWAVLKTYEFVHLIP